MTNVEIQKALIALGYDLGPSGADGVVGPKTKAAISSFQAKLGLPATGIADGATIAELKAQAPKGLSVSLASIAPFALLALGGVSASLLTFWGLGKAFGRDSLPRSRRSVPPSIPSTRAYYNSESPLAQPSTPRREEDYEERMASSPARRSSTRTLVTGEVAVPSRIPSLESAPRGRGRMATLMTGEAISVPSLSSAPPTVGDEFPPMTVPMVR